MLCLRASSATETPILRFAFNILRNCTKSFPVRRTRFPFARFFADAVPFERAGRPRCGFGLADQKQKFGATRVAQ